MSDMPYEEDEGREELSEEEQEWAGQLSDLIHDANMAHYFAQMDVHQPQAFLTGLPEESKGLIYERAMELLAYRADQEHEMISEAVH